MKNLNDVKSEINTVIENSAKYKNGYFWTPYGGASQRRSREFSISFEFEHSGQQIEVRQSLSLSCRNFYFHTHVTRNGKKSNISILKKVVAQA